MNVEPKSEECISWLPVPPESGLPDRAEPVSWDVIPCQNFISSDPNVCGGELCLSSTRVPVTVVLDSLAEGSTREEILRSYPSLRPEHIDAALSYAAELAHQERLVPIRAK